ncbi:MAG TPA: methylenetetrahydrofolate reductase C-terminal domain-containing protein [Coriobacteriia bacterium]|nr:methylenetetrahydrofolate reductase C-terminal domain-containing protein [Coriobacteriia bacterium]
MTRPREWVRVVSDLGEVRARSVFLVGCGQCATVAGTGGQDEVLEAQRRLVAEGFEVTGWTVGDVTCHSGEMRLEMRRHSVEIERADALVVLACGAGVQTVAEWVSLPVFPALESAFLGTIVRRGVFEERCQMCGACVLDVTGGICPVTTCPKGLLNGPCGGMWDGRCELLSDRDCAHVRIQRRLAEQGRDAVPPVLPPRDFSASTKPGSVDLRGATGRRARRAEADRPEGDDGR